LLIDDYLPRFHARERHETIVQASPMQVYAALRTADLGDSSLVRVLLGLRGLPVLLSQSRGPGRQVRMRQRSAALTLGCILGHGFYLLAEAPGQELLIGLEGRFWTLRGGLLETDPISFRQRVLAGTAKAAWNFTVEAQSRGRTRLATETRIHCADEASRRAFCCYWLVVRPFSGVIRRRMLRSIRRAAEHPAA